MELGSVSAVLGKDCLCRQISVSAVVTLSDSTCLCYQVSLNVRQIHQDSEGWDIFTLYFIACGQHKKKERQGMSLWLLLAGYRVYEERQDSEMGISGGKIRLTSYYRRKVHDWWLCLLIIVIMYSWRNFRKNNCEQAENIRLCYEVKQRDQQGRWKMRERVHP